MVTETQQEIEVIIDYGSIILYRWNSLKVGSLCRLSNWPWRKGQILADFIVERPEDDTPNIPMEDEEELSDP
ncbi:hypothetical protein Tco_1446711 [Tanacetum coccineum]